MRHILSVVTFLLAAGCAHDPPAATPAPGPRLVGAADSSAAYPRAAATRPAIGARVTWRGVAANHKVGAFLAGPGIYVDLPGRHWPDTVVGKPVEVTGTIVECHDLPVFIQDPDELPTAGIPVRPGTDLHEAGRRFILEDVEWKRVPVGR